MTAFRIVSYNIHRSRGMDWKVRPDRIAAVLDEVGADIVCLQEALRSQADYVSAHLKTEPVFGHNEYLHGQEYGNVTFSRFPIRFTRNYNLSVRNREKRGCLRTDILLDGRLLHLLHVHLGTSFFERRRQGVQLASREILQDPTLTGARLLVGDFNEWTRGLTTRLLGVHLKSTRKRTYPGVLPLLHLDHIYHDPQLRLERLQLHRTPASLIASDHLPLVADFAWEP